MPLLLITIDTNLVDPKEVAPLEKVLTDIPHEIGFVSVTEREHGYEIGYLGRRVTESGVWGESPWGSSNWSGPKPAQFVVGESTVAPDGAIPGHYDVVAGDGSLLESALTIISAGSFPKIGQRENLTSNVRRQLRDAMIFEAHVRAGRHVLVSNDVKAYVKDGRRARLEALGRTKIRTLVEFVDVVANGRTDDLLPPA
jgi:hypothetical protein